MAPAADIKEVRNLFNIAYPAKAPFDSFVPGGQVGAWLDAGNSPQKISAGLVQGMQALGFTVDPPGGPTAGTWTGARQKAFSGHFNLQDTIEPHFLEGKPMPADSYIVGRISSSAGGPSVNYDGTPAGTPPVVTPPDTTPPDAGVAKAEQVMEWATNRFTGNEVRISTLEEQVKKLLAG